MIKQQNRRPQIIIAHMEELLKLKPSTGEKQPLYDKGQAQSFFNKAGPLALGLPCKGESICGRKQKGMTVLRATSSYSNDPRFIKPSNKFALQYSLGYRINCLYKTNKDR